MRREVLKTKEQFIDNCPCAWDIIQFVKSIKDTDV